MPVTQNPAEAINAAIARAERLRELTDPEKPVSYDAAWPELHELSAEISILLHSITHIIHGASS
jgi:hypothetical protein